MTIIDLPSLITGLRTYLATAKYNAVSLPADLVETAVKALEGTESLETALKKIACFDDGKATYHLEAHGSYGYFDEPGSVAIAREALSAVRKSP